MNERLKRLRLSDRAVYAWLSATIGVNFERAVACQHIAEAEGISERTVRRSLGRLAHAKLITRRGPPGSIDIIRVFPVPLVDL